MTDTNTVRWLQKEMEGAVRLGLPLVGCSDWPSPDQTDPPELMRTLGEGDVQRAIGLAHRRGIAACYIAAAFNAAEAARDAGESKNWVADLIDILDNLPPGIQPVRSGRL